MEARDSDKRLTRLVVAGLLILIAVGLWHSYGAWALDAVRTSGH